MGKAQLFMTVVNSARHVNVALETDKAKKLYARNKRLQTVRFKT